MMTARALILLIILIQITKVAFSKDIERYEIIIEGKSAYITSLKRGSAVLVGKLESKDEILRSDPINTFPRSVIVLAYIPKFNITILHISGELDSRHFNQLQTGEDCTNNLNIRRRSRAIKIEQVGTMDKTFVGQVTADAKVELGDIIRDEKGDVCGIVTLVTESTFVSLTADYINILALSDATYDIGNQ